MGFEPTHSPWQGDMLPLTSLSHWLQEKESNLQASLSESDRCTCLRILQRLADSERVELPRLALGCFQNNFRRHLSD